MARGVKRADSKAGLELDALVLQVVMGWQWVPLERPDGPARQLLWDTSRGRPAGDDFQELRDGRLVPSDAPRPSTDANAAREVEARVAERRLEYPYTVALLSLLQDDGRQRRGEGWREAWLAARAAPAQRCRAALRAAGLTTEEAPPSLPTRTSDLISGGARPRIGTADRAAPRDARAADTRSDPTPVGTA